MSTYYFWLPHIYIYIYPNKYIIEKFWRLEYVLWNQKFIRYQSLIKLMWSPAQLITLCPFLDRSWVPSRRKAWAWRQRSPPTSESRHLPRAQGLIRDRIRWKAGMQAVGCTVGGYALLSTAQRASGWWCFLTWVGHCHGECASRAINQMLALISAGQKIHLLAVQLYSNANAEDQQFKQTNILAVPANGQHDLFRLAPGLDCQF